jgi:hypothetical protein
VLRFEGIRNVFEEEQTKNNMLVFSGIHVVAESIRRRPEL